MKRVNENAVSLRKDKMLHEIQRKRQMISAAEPAEADGIKYEDFVIDTDRNEDEFNKFERLHSKKR